MQIHPFSMEDLVTGSFPSVLTAEGTLACDSRRQLRHIRNQPQGYLVQFLHRSSVNAFHPQQLCYGSNVVRKE